MTAPLRTSWEVQVTAGASPAVVRVKNLQSTIEGPHDAWGRSGRPQPISISASVSLAKPFGSSSSTDAVNSDTVHYGLLSKAILSALGSVARDGANSKAASQKEVLERIWLHLSAHYTFGEVDDGHVVRKPFLDISLVRCLTVTAHLPKASLLGGGVSLTSSAIFTANAAGSSMKMRAMMLRLHDLRVPTLIGVNANEREAKQVVVANIEIEKLRPIEDVFCTIEAVVVETMSDSSYETLEALAADLAGKIAKYLASNHLAPADGSGWQIKIGLEKPIAVVLADAACVELSVNTNDIKGIA